MTAILAMLLAAGPAREPVTPDAQVRACLQFADFLAAEHRRAGHAGGHPDLPYLRFVSWHGIEPEYVEEVKALAGYLVNTVSQGELIFAWRDVPATGGLVSFVDIRHPKWNARAVSAVFRREKLFFEPFVTHTPAESLRVRLGIKQDPDTLHSEAVVWGPWLLRRIAESGIDPTYYDLLYANQRFVNQSAWPGGVYSDGKTYPAGAFKLIDPAGKEEAFVDFPKNEGDWEEFWGIKAAADFFKRQRRLGKTGEIVQGASNDPKGKGSFVSYNDRVIVFVMTPDGPAMETYDNVKTAGDRDYIEEPEKVAAGEIQADAGELLVTLPNKLQACLLINGKKERAEDADAKVVRNTKDGKSVVVRTQIGCITCHAPEGGIVSPSNRLYADTFVHGGVRRRFKSEDERLAVEAFFKSREPEYREWRGPNVRATAEATTTPAYPKGMTGTQVAAALLKFRTWYDTPVTAGRAAAEAGLPVAAFRHLCLQSASTKLKRLAAGLTVPRTVWDADGSREFGLLFDAAVDSADPLQRLKSADLLLDLEAQLKKGTGK